MFTKLVIAALLIEAIWENAKMIYQAGKFSYDKLGAIILSIVVCLAAGIDIFALLGITLTVPFLGCILTGLLISRGANAIHDLIKLIENVKTNTVTSLLGNTEGAENDSSVANLTVKLHADTTDFDKSIENLKINAAVRAPGLGSNPENCTIINQAAANTACGTPDMVNDKTAGGDQIAGNTNESQAADPSKMN